MWAPPPPKKEGGVDEFYKLCSVAVGNVLDNLLSDFLAEAGGDGAHACGNK